MAGSDRSEQEERDDFNLPPTMSAMDSGLGRDQASIGQITSRILLEQYAPSAVTVDRHYRVVYSHGDTTPYLNPPPGEPTRDVMRMARHNVREALRTVLHEASTENRAATSQDAFVDTDRGIFRIEVTAAPLDPSLAPAHFLVTFHQRPQAAPAQAAAQEVMPADTQALPQDLQRLEDFLASLSHELRTPLSSILMWSQMLLKTDLNEAERREGLQAIEHSAQAQRLLLDDLLDISPSHSGELRLQSKLEPGGPQPPRSP